MRKPDSNRVAIAARLGELARSGQLTPQIVVKDAKSPDSPLHSLFEWDNGKAARAWRLEQARALLRVRYEMIIEDRTVSVPLFIRDPRKGGTEQGYVSLSSIMNDSVMAKASLRNEFRNAEAYLLRAREIAVALRLEPYVDRILARLAAVKAKAAPTA